ncbi:MAG: arylesterase [Rhodobacteraceae bacterium]|nr:arylesterase [Paracoccaceae bacterium]
MNAFFDATVALAYKITRGVHKLVLTMFFSGVAICASANEIVIVAFGDSLTYGYGLPTEDGFVPQLEIWLRDRGADVRIINAGVSGDTTGGGLARVDWVLGDDVDAVILELGANDFLRGIPPAVARENLDAIMAIIIAKDLPVLIAGMPAPTNYGAAYKTEFDAIYPMLAEKYRAPLYPYFMNGIVEGHGAADPMDFIQADGLHPNAAGAQLIVQDIGPAVLALISSMD